MVRIKSEALNSRNWVILICCVYLFIFIIIIIIINFFFFYSDNRQDVSSIIMLRNVKPTVKKEDVSYVLWGCIETPWDSQSEIFEYFL